MKKAILALTFILILIMGCGNAQKADEAMAKAEKLLEDGQVNASIEQYMIAIENYREDSDLANAHLMLGRAYAAKNNVLKNKDMALFDSTMANFKFALNHSQTDSQKVTVLDNIGMVKDLIGDKQGAIAAYNEIIHLSDRSDVKASAYVNKGSVHRTMGNYNESIKSFENAAKATDDKRIQALTLRNFGEIAAVRGNYDKAIKNLGEALLAFPENEDKGIVCLSMANVYEYKGELEKAIEKYEQAIRLMEDDINLTDAYNGIGAIYFKKGDYQKADANFYMALNYAPMNAQRLLNYGFSRLYLDDVDSAFACFSKAIGRNEELKRTIAKSGEIHRWINDRKNAARSDDVRSRLEELIKPLVLKEI
ncbi:MAG: tetratricopeptide repeat protein [Candidatus Zixiibacteriota bacterium]